jgi:hypothetical protein
VTLFFADVRWVHLTFVIFQKFLQVNLSQHKVVIAALVTRRQKKMLEIIFFAARHTSNNLCAFLLCRLSHNNISIRTSAFYESLFFDLHFFFVTVEA